MKAPEALAVLPSLPVKSTPVPTKQLATCPDSAAEVKLHIAAQGVDLG